MSNLLLLLLFIACLSISAMWIAENPGTVRIEWFDREIETSFAFLIVMTMVAAVVLAALYTLLRAILRVPAMFSGQRSLKHYKKALTEITYSVAALAASDTATASAHTRKAEKLLGTTPLTLLLSAQVARNQGDDKKAQALLEQLLDHKETEYLAARSLSEAAGKNQMLPRALALAERARGINSSESAAALAVIGLQVRMGQWQEALLELKKAKGMTRAQKRELRGKLLLAQGQSLLASGLEEEALPHARAVLACLPEFVPALCFAAEVYSHNQQEGKGLKLLQKAWARESHPQLAEAIRTLAMKEAPARQKKILAALHDASPLAAPLWHCSACETTEANWRITCSQCNGFNTFS